MEHMSVMISEILYENRRASVTTQRLVTTLLSQISNTPYGRVVRAENEVPELRVWINEVRMLRALANVLQTPTARWTRRNSRSSCGSPPGRTGTVSA